MAVLWYDILDDTNDWKHGEPTLEPMLITTVGILFSTHKDHIILVRDVYTEEDGGWVTGGRLAVPKGVIKEIIELEAMNEPRQNLINGKRIGKRTTGKGLRPSPAEPSPDR